MPPSNTSPLARLGASFENLLLYVGKPSSNRRKYILVGIVTMVAIALWAPRLKGPIDLRWDAGVYFDLGASLAAGEGYRIRTEPGNPAGVQYPPGLPAIVALHIFVLGTDDPDTVGTVLRFTFFGFYLAYGLACLVLARRILPDLWALIATVFILFQGHNLVISNLLFTEIPFALLSVCLVLLIDGRWKDNPTWKNDGIALLLAAAGFALRTAGIVLLIAWPLSHFLRARWRRFIVTSFLAFLPVLVWQMHVHRVQQSRDYLEPAYAYQRAPYQFYNVPYAENALLADPFTPEQGTISKADLIKRMISHAWKVPLAFGESASTIYGYCVWCIERFQHRFLGRIIVPGLAASKLLNLIGITAFAGCLLLFRRKEYAQGLVVMGTAGLVCLTPWPEQFARYLVPVVPFLVIGFVSAILGLNRWLNNKVPLLQGRTWFIPAIVFPVIFLLQVYAIKKIFTSNDLSDESGREAPSSLFYYDEPWVHWQKAADWISRHASSDDVVATTSSHLFYLQTEIKAVYPPMEIDPVKARRLMENVPIRYLIVDETVHLDVARRYGLPAVESDLEHWRLVFQVDETRVYQNTAVNQTHEGG